MTAHRIKAYIYLLIVAAIWGIAGPVIKFTLNGIDPLSFLVYRFAISTAISIILLLNMRTSLAKIKSSFVLIVVYSLLATTIALGFLFLGLKYTGVLDLVLLAAIGPLVTIFTGVVFLKEHVTFQEKIGILIAFLGVIIATILPLFIENQIDHKISGNILIFLSIFAGSGSALSAKKLVQKDIDPLDLVNISFIIGFLTITPFALASQSLETVLTQIKNLPLIYHFGVWYMAILSGSLAYFLWVNGQKSIEISEAALFGYLQLLFAAPLAVIWLGEKINTSFIIGGTIVATGVIIAEYKRRR